MTNNNQRRSMSFTLNSSGVYFGVAVFGFAILSCGSIEAGEQGRSKGQQRRVGGATEIQNPGESTGPRNRPPRGGQQGGLNQNQRRSPNSQGQGQPREPGQRSGQRPQQAPTAEQVFSVFDQNQDGQIDRSEVPQVSQQQFNSVDTDGNQTCDRGEFQIAFDELQSKAQRNSNQRTGQGRQQNVNRGRPTGQRQQSGRGGQGRQQRSSGSGGGSQKQCGSMQQRRRPAG